MPAATGTMVACFLLTAVWARRCMKTITELNDDNSERTIAAINLPVLADLISELRCERHAFSL